MADLYQWWMQDLTIMPDGDLLICSGATKTGEVMPGCATDEGEQRVSRRLLTACATEAQALSRPILPPGKTRAEPRSNRRPLVYL